MNEVVVTDAEFPETRFARPRSGSTIAYQVFGDGPVTITSAPPMAQNIEMAWEWWAIRRMSEGFASFSSPGCVPSTASRSSALRPPRSTDPITRRRQSPARHGVTIPAESGVPAGG